MLVPRVHPATVEEWTLVVRVVEHHSTRGGDMTYETYEQEELSWEKAWFLYEEGLGPNPMEGFRTMDR